MLTAVTGVTLLELYLADKGADSDSKISIKESVYSYYIYATIT